jgi:RNA methyltransferase, TrmH family
MARIEQISSLANPKVKGIAALAQKKERVESGLFVVEGLQLVGFGVEAGWELVTLVTSRHKDTRAQGHKDEEFVSRLYAAAGLVLEVTPAVLEKLVRKDNPQGVVGVFRQQTMGLHEFSARLASPSRKLAGRDGEALTSPTAHHDARGDVAVVLEGIRDPGNLGTIIRTVDAVGAKGVILAGTCTDLWAPEVLRATMGSIFHVPVVQVGMERFLAWKEGARLTMVGTHLRGTTDYREVAKLRGANGTSSGLLVAMGTEQSGLSEEMTNACDILTKIAMRGGAESLNLSIATAVMLYEIFRD